jgi:hypothetical protein
MSDDTVEINRAPVLTLWAAIVAEHQGYEADTALTLGKAVSGLNAQAKGRMIGVFGPPKGRAGETPKKVGLGEDFWLQVCGRPVPAKNTQEGVRAVIKDKPIDPAGVRRYLESKFRAALPRVRAAMEELAAALTPEALEDDAYPLYERFRPNVAKGIDGWGQVSTLDLGLIRSLAEKARAQRRGG